MIRGSNTGCIPGYRQISNQPYSSLIKTDFLRTIFRWLSALILFSYSVLSFAGTYTVLPGQSFQLMPCDSDDCDSDSEGLTQQLTFPALDPNGVYSLNISIRKSVNQSGNADADGDGDDGDDSEISSTISLNGSRVFFVDEFELENEYQSGYDTSKVVTLEANNWLDIQIEGDPGVVLTLEVIGEDTVTPTLSSSISPAANVAGWHQQDVSVRFQCDDITSGIASCPDPVSVTTEGAAQVITGTAIDNAGNQASASETINLDKTPPTITAEAIPVANTSGWHKNPVQVIFTCQDNLAGVASCESPVSISTEGAGQLVTGSSTDVAGNTAQTSLTLNIDMTPPSIQITSPVAGSVLAELRPAILWSVADNLALDTGSLVLSVNGITFDGDCTIENGAVTCVPVNDLPTGEIVLFANVDDHAGNTGTEQVNFRIEIDIDDDSDGVDNATDLCPGTFPGINVDNTGCPIVIADDADNDTFADSGDNCPTIFNPGQTDTDNNGTGDACEIVGTINITNPTPGQTINTSTTSVTGTFTGPVGSGVTVNGRKACVYNNQFVINNILLNSGDYTLTAQLVPTVGIGESTEVTINRNGDSLYSIEPNSNCAVAPFDAQFTLDDLDAGIQQMEIDYDNDGATDDIIVDFSNPILEHTYTNPGTYQVNITGLDVDSNPYSQILNIIVQDGVAIDTEIQSCWQNITVGLSSNNTAQALNELTPSAQQKFAPVFEALQGNLPTILSTFSNLQIVDINTDYAEYAINRSIDGVDRIFLIYFVKDENGDWKLDAM